jgi:hypothetical protein
MMFLLSGLPIGDYVSLPSALIFRFRQINANCYDDHDVYVTSWIRERPDCT